MRSVRKGPLAALVSQAARRTGYGLNTELPLVCGTIVGDRDRTVRPEEGLWPDAAQLVLPYTQRTLFRPRTARAVTHFFETGRFRMTGFGDPFKWRLDIMTDKPYGSSVHHLVIFMRSSRS